MSLSLTPTVSRMSSSSNLDSFCDGWSGAVQLLFCGLLPLGLAHYSLQHSCVIAVKLFLQKKLCLFLLCVKKVHR